MDGHTISHAAEQTGFAASALRFYEDAGLVVPARTASGYRAYSDDDLDRLAFVARAKGFGLSLDEIAELLDLLDEDRCEPVQDRLRALIDTKLTHAQATIAELEAFAAELRRITAGFDHHTADGACDDQCGCRTDPLIPDQLTGEPLTLVDKPPSPPIACTLPAAEVPNRIGEWRALLAEGDIIDTDGGMRVQFPAGTDPAPIAALAAAEQGCCSFFTFVLTIDAVGIELLVNEPPHAAGLAASLVGAAS